MKTIFTLILSVFIITGCSANPTHNESSNAKNATPISTNAVAYFASGCFWCVEAVFQSVKGVGNVVSGYSGGKKSTATYRMVSSGNTKHAESVAVHYDSTKVDYKTLLKVFFGSQDPTTLNQQGPDRGTQYRSVIFYRNGHEKKLANDYIQQLLDNNTFPKITTQVVPFNAFYKAEDYHQEYEKNHPNDSYVRAVSKPRLHKFQEKFPELLK